MSPILLCLSLAAGPPSEVRHHVLENGLSVLLLEDHQTPLVSVGVMYRVGARNEAPGITGIAHFVEHMAFRDLEGFPGSDSTESVTRLGGRWSGYTWIDQTYYAATVPREALDRMLEIEARRMRDARFAPEAFEKERGSVIAELHSYDDPHSLLYDAVLATSFEIHPYRFNTIGWLSDVQALTRDEVYAFYRRYYHPANAVVVVVGDMDPDRALDQVRQRLGALEAGGASSELRTLEPPQTGPKRVVVERPGPHAEVLLAFRAPALTDPDFAAMVVFDALLAGGKGFRFSSDYAVAEDTLLRQRTVGAGLARDATSNWQASRYPYVYSLRADAASDADLGTLEAAMMGALRSAAERRWSAAEIARALGQIQRAASLDLDDLAGRAHQLAFFEVAGGFRHLLEMPERLARVGPQELAGFAAKWLQPHQVTVGWFVPGEAATGPPPPPTEERSVAAPRRRAAPGPAEVGPGASPAVFRLTNGLEVDVAPRSASGLVAFAGRIDAGSLYDGGTPGLLALATEHLATATPPELAEAPRLVWSLHEQPASAVNTRWIAFEAYGLPEELAPLLRSFAARVRSAAPSGEGWSRLVASAARRASTAAETVEAAIWSRALGLLYSASSPLARPAWASGQALAGLDEKALRRFLDAHVTPPRTRLALAGAVDPARARALLEETLGGWKGGAGPPLPRLTGPRGPERWEEAQLSLPGKAQNDIAVLWPGDRSGPADAAATRALGYLLGETYYAGRLGRALVGPGLVYAVWTTLEEDGAPGFFVVRTAAAPENTAEVLRRIREVLEGTARQGFTAGELAEAQAYLRGKAARARDGTLPTARSRLRQLLGQPELPAEALTLQELNDAARRLFHHGAPLAIVAGPGLPTARKPPASSSGRR